MASCRKIQHAGAEKVPWASKAPWYSRALVEGMFDVIFSAMHAAAEVMPVCCLVYGCEVAACLKPPLQHQITCACPHVFINHTVHKQCHPNAADVMFRYHTQPTYSPHRQQKTPEIAVVAAACSQSMCSKR